MSDQLRDPGRFEERLAHELTRFAAAGVRDIDALRTAESIVTSAPRVRFGLTLSRPRFGWTPVVVLVMALALLGAAVLVSGNLPHLLPSRQPRLGLITGGQLVVVDAAGPHPVDVIPTRGYLPDDAAVLKAVRISPDGRTLAVVLGQEIGDTFWHGLWILTPDGHVLRELTEAEFAWAPDSAHLLAADLRPDPGRRGLIVLARDPQPSGLATLSADRLPLPKPGYPLGVGWRSPSEGIVVAKEVTFIGSNGSYTSEGGAITAWIVDIETGAVVPAAEWADAAAVAVSPHGRQIAYLAGATLHAVTIGGSECTVRLGLPDAMAVDDWWPAIAWSPDEGRVAVTLTRDGHTGIWLLPASCAGTPAPIVSGTFAGSIAEDNSFSGPEPAIRVSAGEAVRGPLAWSADGAWIYYRGLTPEQNSSLLPHFDLRRIPTDGGASELVAPRVEWFDLAFTP